MSTDVSIVDLDTGAVVSAGWHLDGLTGAGDFQVSPDGSTVVFEGESLDAGGTQLYLADANGGDVRKLTSEFITATEGSWSPDGTEIVFRSGFDQGAQIAVIDVESGDVRTITDEGLVFDPSFEAAGSILFTRGRRRPGGGLRVDLWRVPASGGDATLAVPLGAFGSSSPDGQTIAYHGTSHHVGCPGPCWELDPRISFITVDGSAPDPSGFNGVVMSVDVAADSVRLVARRPRRHVGSTTGERDERRDRGDGREHRARARRRMGQRPILARQPYLGGNGLLGRAGPSFHQRRRPRSSMSAPVWRIPCRVA